MVIFRFWPALCIWVIDLLLAFLSRRGKFARTGAFCCVLGVSLVILLILMEGGALPEGLACLLPILYWILPKETRHEL